MKYRAAIAILVLPLLFSSRVALGSCPNVSGPLGSPCMYYVYDVSECLSTSGNVGGDTLCYSTPGHSFDYASPGGEAFASWTFTADSSNGTWSVSNFVDFYDPADSAFNFVWIQVVVTHNGNSTPTLYYTRNGTQSDVNCDYASTNFAAQSGDTVTINVGSQALNSGVAISVSDPYITRANC